jgi:hypothetical protein
LRKRKEPKVMMMRLRTIPMSSPPSLLTAMGRGQPREASLQAPSQEKPQSPLHPTKQSGHSCTCQAQARSSSPHLPQNTP